MRPSLLAFAAAIAVLLSGCGSEEQNLTEIETSHGAVHEDKPELNASAEVKGRTAIIRLRTDMNISPDMYGKEKKKGQGHIHMYLDDGEKKGITAVPIVLENLTPGTHTVKLSLHNNDHTPYGTTKTLTIQIK